MDRTTKAVLEFFEMVSAVPRPSRKEEQIRARLIEWAVENGLDHRTDPAGNLVIVVPATPGYENGSTVILQGHMDMVCEKRPEIDFDFQTDGIRTLIDGEWLAADGTTLGADNGIAIAVALAIAADRSVAHPRLELLFTVDEESGLTGATQLSGDIVSGSMLINLDSEDDGVITVGCAGGVNVVIRMDATRITKPGSAGLYHLGVGGLSGGHSGTDIALGRGNANVLLARALSPLLDDPGFSLLTVSGGNAHNAIPREAQARFVISPTGLEQRLDRVRAVARELKSEFATTDPGLTVSVEPAAPGDAKDHGLGLISHGDSVRFVQLLRELPNGPVTMSPRAEGLVETSSNVAIVKSEPATASVLVSLRGSVPSQLEQLTGTISAIATRAGSTSSHEAAYSGWEPDYTSPLLQRAKRVYRDRYGVDPTIEVVHAGLECGVIGTRYPAMQMLSVGPTIVNPHSPDERLHLPSISRLWDFLCDLLADFR